MCTLEGPSAHWPRAAIGIVIVGLGGALFLEMPLPSGQGTFSALVRCGISLGALFAFFGLRGHHRGLSERVQTTSDRVMPQVDDRLRARDVIASDRYLG